MPQQKGSTVDLMLGFEATYKTVATTGFLLPFNSSGVKETQALNKAATLTGTRNPPQPFLGNRDVNGPLVIPCDSVAMWYWLKAMFGDPSTGSGPPYTHEFKVGDTMPSFSLETAFEDLATNEYQRFLGCKIAGYSMSLGGDGELVGNVNVMGASGSLETSPFDASPTAVTMSRLNNFQAAITEGGGALSNATEVSFDINFGLDPKNYPIGSNGVRGSLPEGDLEIKGNIKTMFEDTSLLTKAISNTESGIKITITGSASSIFEIEFQELVYERNTPDIPGPEGLLVDLNFQAYYANGSEASAVVARLTNSDEHA